MIATEIKLISESTQGLLAVIEDEELELDQGLVCWEILEASRKALGLVSELLAARMAALMPGKQHTIMGVGTFEKHRKSDRTEWQKDDLLRAVLDSRLVDKDGVVKEETLLDRVLHVWNLGAPRTTALKARHIDPDEFAHVEQGALTLQLHN